eukprot:TRINITY_DN18489_c0_g1_i2.p1 TRINITY_DN18489_c0_g1~~TRINITY_DN18489_c0_g1_i2.p1  ORF type:complete len:413 (+),score=79.60 TRINITY_DN18489_c0_g1_i2:85-1323(+)
MASAAPRHADCSLRRREAREWHQHAEVIEEVIWFGCQWAVLHELRQVCRLWRVVAERTARRIYAIPATAMLEDKAPEDWFGDGERDPSRRLMQQMVLSFARGFVRAPSVILVFNPQQDAPYHICPEFRALLPRSCSILSVALQDGREQGRPVCIVALFDGAPPWARDGYATRHAVTVFEDGQDRIVPPRMAGPASRLRGVLLMQSARSSRCREAVARHSGAGVVVAGGALHSMQLHTGSWPSAAGGSADKLCGRQVEDGFLGVWGANTEVRALLIRGRMPHVIAQEAARAADWARDIVFDPPACPALKDDQVYGIMAISFPCVARDRYVFEEYRAWPHAPDVRGLVISGPCGGEVLFETVDDPSAEQQTDHSYTTVWVTWGLSRRPRSGPLPPPGSRVSDGGRVRLPAPPTA